MPQQARSRATRDAVVEAAAQVFAADGYEAAAVARVAALAGVSIGSLYQYFPTKEALVAAVEARASAGIIAFLEPRMMALAAAPLREGVRAMSALIVEAHAREGRLLRALDGSPRSGTPTETAEFERRVRVGLRLYLEARRDEIRPTDLDLAVTVLMSAADAVAHQLLRERPLGDHDAIVDELAALLYGYLRP